MVNIGDLVKLKSGSPTMTVNGFAPQNKVVCVFYNEETQLFVSHDFYPVSLEVVED